MTFGMDDLLSSHHHSCMPKARAAFLMTAAVCRTSHQYMRTRHWAARCNTQLLVKLTPKVVVFSSLCHFLFLGHTTEPQGVCCHAGTWRQGRQQWMVSVHKPWPPTWTSRASALAMADPSCPCWSLLWPTRYATPLLTCVTAVAHKVCRNSVDLQQGLNQTACAL